MEETKETQVESTQEASGTEEKKDVVAYDSYTKVLGEKKKKQQEAETLRAELEEIKQKQMEERGDLKGIVESYKEKTMNLENQLREERKKFLYNSVTGAIKTEAIKNGCVSPNDFIKTLDREDFETLQSEEGQIKEDSLFSLIERTKKNKPYFFKKGEVKFNDATPSNDMPKSKGLEDMSKEEIEAKLRELDN